MNRKQQLANKLKQRRKQRNERLAASASTKYNKLMVEVRDLKKRLKQVENGDK